MNEWDQRLAIAEAVGWKPSDGDIAASKVWEEITGQYCPPHPPDYVNDLNLMHEAEKLILTSTKPWSSRGQDHEPMRYIAMLYQVLGVETREELVLSVEAKDIGKLNNRPKPWPHPIELPSSAIVLSHCVPLAGWDMKLIRATAPQRAEAFLRTIGKWQDHLPAKAL